MRVRGFIVLLLVAGALTAACSSSSSAASPALYGQDGKQGPTMAPVMPAASAAGFGGIAVATVAPGPESGVPIPSGAAPAATPNAAQPENQVIKTGTISIQVAAVDDSIAIATDQIHALGGWLAGSDRTTRTASDMASVTYRVPVNRFEDALAAMRKLGTKILSEHTESTPVGGEIIDLQSRITNLRASEKAIQAIMLKANTIGDVLTVQQRLAEVQGQIEQLSGQLAGLTDQSAYSTLTVVLVVPILPTPSPSATPSPSPELTATAIPWNAGTQAGQAADALGEVGKALATVLIWVAILVVPVTLAFILMLVVLGFAGRRLDPYRKRLLPFTVGKPVTYQQPSPQGWFVPGRPGTPGVPGVPGTQPEDQPKV